MIDDINTYQINSDLSNCDCPSDLICLIKSYFYLHLSDLSALVVAAKNRDSVSIAYFECNHECHDLHRVVSSVDIISHKEIVCVWELSAYFEQLDQIVELSMDVATDGHWGANVDHVRLVGQNFFSFTAQVCDLGLRERLAGHEDLNLSV